MRIADRGGRSSRQDVAIELGRRDQAALDVNVCVDEAGDGDQPAAVDLSAACETLVNTDDAIAGNRDVAYVSSPRTRSRILHVLDDQVRRAMAECLRNFGQTVAPLSGASEFGTSPCAGHPSRRAIRPSGRRDIADALVIGFEAGVTF